MMKSQVSQLSTKTKKLQRQLGPVLKYLVCFLHFAASYYKYWKGSPDFKKIFLQPSTIWLYVLSDTMKLKDAYSLEGKLCPT